MTREGVRVDLDNNHVTIATPNMGDNRRSLVFHDYNTVSLGSGPKFFSN